MLDDIMKNPLRMTETVDRVISELKGQDRVVSELKEQQVDLFVVGPTSQTGLVENALQNAQCSVNVVRSADAPSLVRSKREGSGHVAIVGMSGRFPGSENLRDFWDVLARGQDLHEQVVSPTAMIQ